MVHRTSSGNWVRNVKLIYNFEICAFHTNGSWSLIWQENRVGLVFLVRVDGCLLLHSCAIGQTGRLPNCVGSGSRLLITAIAFKLSWTLTTSFKPFGCAATNPCHPSWHSTNRFQRLTCDGSWYSNGRLGLDHDTIKLLFPYHHPSTLVKGWISQAGAKSRIWVLRWWWSTRSWEGGGHHSWDGWACWGEVHWLVG